MAYRIEEMISEEEVNRRIRELGEQITKDYEGRTVRLVCILRGAVFFMCELAKRIELPVRFDFMSVSSYGSGTSSSGIVRIIKDLEDPVTDESRSSSRAAALLQSVSARCLTNLPAVRRESTLKSITPVSRYPTSL